LLCKQTVFRHFWLKNAVFGVAFHINRFAFPALCALHNHYISINELPHSLGTPSCEGTPCNSTAWRCVMKFFSRFFARRDSNLTTALERQRLGKTMPGQPAAMAGARLGFLVR
jgi:hypothetical protein